MTVFRVPNGPRPSATPAPPAPPMPFPAPRAPDAVPGQAVAAGLLGLASAVLSAVTGSVLVLLAAALEQDFAVLLAAVTVLSGSHLAGAVLVLCRRPAWLLVATSVPLAGVGAVVLFAALSGLAFDGVDGTSGVPIGMGICATAAATLASSAAVRRWTASRPSGAAALRTVPRWP